MNRVIGCNLHLNVNVISPLTVEALSLGSEKKCYLSLLLQATFLTALALMAPDCLHQICLLGNLNFVIFHPLFSCSQTKSILMRFQKVMFPNRGENFLF